jgi:two-component system NtrC family sensor kinase
MRLAWKLGLVLVSAMVLILAINSYVGVQREKEYFAQEMRHEARVLGRSLRVALRDVLVSHGEARARAVVGEIDRVETSIDLRWVSLGGGTDAPELALSRVQQATATDDVVTLLGPGEERSFTYVLLPGGHRPALEISRSLTDQRAFVHRGVVARVVTTVLFSAIAGALATALVAWLVGRPLRQLTAKAQRIGEGVLHPPLVLDRDDELADFAGEMNAMCDRLAAATTRATEEASARMQALEQLQHADRLATVGRVASGLAHELATPLNIVSGWAKMLASTDGSPTRRREATDAIQEQVDRMSHVIRQLLDFSRRRRDAHRDRVAATDLVQRTLALIEPLASKRDVAISVRAEEGDLHVHADPTQLQQAISNLALNALDAMGNGGTLTIVTRRVARNIEISLADTGGGIETADLPHVFDAFFTTKDVGFGTGLGLSIARDIIREHGGDITVESVAGSGTTFTIRLSEMP